MAGETGILDSILSGLGSAFKDFNWGTALKGAGELAGAWGQYQNSKAQNALMNKQFNYEVGKDQYVKDRMDEAQNAVNTAFGVTGTTKKKNNDGTTTGSATTALSM